MGKVFSWEDVKKGSVPNLESGFGAVKKYIESQINNFAGITAAVLCGSFLTGKHTIRSDMDCVLVYSEDEQSECIRFFQELIQQAGTYHVPLELVAIRRDIALTPHHPLQATFLEHIALSARKGGTIKGDVVSSFVAPGRTMKDETINYIIAKIRKLEKGWVILPMMGSDEYHRYLSKLLDAPVHIARKVCRAKGINFGNDDSKSSVVRRYGEVSRGREYGMIMELIELDAHYSRELCRHIEDPNQRSYEDLLKKVEREIPTVRDFAYKNLQLL